MKITPPFGIDLGTTRTAAAAFLPDDSQPTVAVDDKGRMTIPSVVQPAGDGRWCVGHDAVDGDDSAALVESAKRFMGSEEPIPDAGDLTAEEVSAIVVSAAVERMRRHLTGRYPDLDLAVRDAVITVPAYFDAPQIEATRRAGELAGLQMAGLVQEPTAAAIYHTWKNDIGDGTFLVYDLGGGTFDVSIIEALFGEYRVLSIDGDNHLGGDDFDRRLADHLRREIADAGFDVAGDVETDDDRRAFETLRQLGRRTKEALSNTTSVELDEQGLFLDRSGTPVDLHTTIDRATFESAIDDLIEATILSCRRGLESAHSRHGLEPEDVDGIFLVGGSTRVPAVPRRLRDTIASELGIDEDRILNDEPETSVARGAALHAAAVAPMRFEDRDEQVAIAITDHPSDNPDRRLIGHVEFDAEPPPTSITFGAGPEDDTESSAPRRVDLEHSGERLRFSAEGFDSAALTPVGKPQVSTTIDRNETAVIGPVQLWLPDRPADATPAPTLALTNPAVLAKDINVEVVEDGKPARHTLVAEGTHLPTTAQHELVTADRSGSVVLRLFQHRLPIHTVVLPIPEQTPPGTPVELSVDIDQAMNITASGAVGDRTFWARIDRPSAPRRREWEEIEALIDRTEDIGERLWGVEGRRFETKRRNLLTGIRAAVRHDPRRLQVLGRRLAALVEDYAPRPQRTPGRNRVDSLLDTIRRLVFSSDEERLGRSRDQWRQQLDELVRQVDDAWEGDDDQRWRSVADRVQAIFESVAQDEYLFRRRDPERYANTLMDTTRGRLQSVHERTKRFPYAANTDARKLQQTEVERIEESIDDLRRRLPDGVSDPEAIPRLERIARSIDHLERRLERAHARGVPRKGESP